MKTYKKHDFPVEKIRRFLEPGPIVLVSSRWKDETNIMTMGWHTVLEFSPSLVGCMITGSNHSFELIRKSKECVINIPTVELLDTAVAIGNCTGRNTDKFEKFGLTKESADNVQAPLIKECFANLECKLVDTRILNKYNFFIFEVLKAHAPLVPKYPKTFHYTGDGVFMISGEHINKRRKFKSQNL
ncbi:flavin reductase family protein [Bdellovibrio sp. HCB185ZH]|uniref:flavin reductase family protein n=1 Tax=Bdellovibrio sp. HCB185ZH TaxID=3394235 RepID=UPI0039A4B762